MENLALPRRSGGEHRGINTLFSIRPYKNKLLTPGASYWIACVHLVIFVMAMSEAIAWGYLGSLFGKGTTGYLAAGIAFLFMFSIIWVIDVSFVTMDLSRSFYDRAILKQDTEKWQDRARLGIGLLGRVMIVLVSLSISAPFLSQIVFKQDVDNEIERRNTASIAAVQDSILADRSAEIAAVDSLILDRETALIEETAGQGASGNYGVGPVTLTMEKNLQRMREERASLLQQRATLESSMQSLSPQEFAGLYNVDLIGNGVQAREEILGSLMENPQYVTAKRAVTAFLAFIFAALVLLKLFQPRSVRIYYNEKLQDLYREYLAGNLNKWIAKEEQSTPEGESQMSPLRFEDWCVNTYSVVRSEDIKRRDSRKIYNLFKMKIEQLEEEKNEIKRMLEPIEAEFDEAMKEISRIKIELLQADSDITQGQRNEEDIAGQLTSIDDDLNNSRFRGSDVLIAVTAKKDLEEKLAQHKNDAIALQHRRNLILHMLDVKENESKDIQELIEKIRTNYRDIQDKIDTERLAYTDMIVSGQVIDFPRGGQQRSAIETSTEDAQPPPEYLLSTPANEPMPERFIGTGGVEVASLEETAEPAVIEEPQATDPPEPPFGNESSVGSPQLAQDEAFGAETDLAYEEPLDLTGTIDRSQPDEYTYPNLIHPSIQETQVEQEEHALPWDPDESAPVPADHPNLFDDVDETDAYTENFDQEPVALNASVPDLSEIPDEPQPLEEESPVTFVDNEQLEAYADAASLSAYETSEEEAAEIDEEDEDTLIRRRPSVWEMYLPHTNENEVEQKDETDHRYLPITRDHQQRWVNQDQEVPSGADMDPFDEDLDGSPADGSRDALASEFSQDRPDETEDILADEETLPPDDLENPETADIEEASYVIVDALADPPADVADLHPEEKDVSAVEFIEDFLRRKDDEAARSGKSGKGIRKGAFGTSSGVN